MQKISLPKETTLSDSTKSGAKWDLMNGDNQSSIFSSNWLAKFQDKHQEDSREEFEKWLYK